MRVLKLSKIISNRNSLVTRLENKSLRLKRKLLKKKEETYKKLNKTLKKKGKLDADDFADVKFKNKVDMTNHKPIIKKKW